jgi:BirA family biotin operon repressor/biotin-[acetyl-CoA-carboxylase] ligase
MTPSEEWHLETRRLGRRVLVYDQLDSTNRLAMAYADDPASDGLAVLARAQTAGRGQHGRSWQCPAGEGVLLSVLVFPPPGLCRPAVLTAWAAVSVCEAVGRATGLQAEIKWPNDVLVRGRKVCGILIEQATRAGGRLATVAGIGLNVRQSAASFAALGLPQAASLAVFAPEPPNCPTMARLLLAQLDAEYDRLCEGDLATLEACWKQRLELLGKPVAAECAGATHRGRLLDVGWDGVQLQLDGGSLLRLPPEAVLHLERDR